MHKLSLPAVIMMLTLSACNSSDNNSNQAAAPTIASGIFKDNFVSGLTYVSGSQTGVTGANGSFTYEEGNTVTFSLGGVTLGTAMGGIVVTPIDLISNASSDSPQVKNIVRFLVMLDSDATPGNGIQISTAVRTIAANWGQVDFRSVDLASDLASITSDVASADARTPTLLSTADAQTHIESTLQCIYAGAYKGTYSGDDQGTFGLLVDAGTNVASGKNEVEGFAYSTIASKYFPFTGDETINTDHAPISPDYIRSFVSGRLDVDDVDNDLDVSEVEITYTGNFSTPDSVSGQWSRNAGPTPLPNIEGVFNGSRIGGASNALYRFTGKYVSSNPNLNTNDAGIYSFDIDNSNNVTGVAYSVVNDVQATLSGTLTGTALAVTTANNVTIAATLNTSTGTIASGTWNDSGNSGTFTGSGCRLN